MAIRRFLRCLFASVLSLCAFSFAAAEADCAHAIPSYHGSMGSISAIEWVERESCPDDYPDSCFEMAEASVLMKLEEHMERYRCVAFSEDADRRDIVSETHKIRGNDRIVVSATAHNVLCRIDPEDELLKIHPDRLISECSKVLWKCNILWIPDDNKALNFIGRLPF
ncbi:MAG TPA: hypothetical protein PKU96_07445 [bacterium]|nr:hypothetical protein [bacterium]